jgi:hypothetical protein
MAFGDVRPPHLGVEGPSMACGVRMQEGTSATAHAGARASAAEAQSRGRCECRQRRAATESGVLDQRHCLIFPVESPSSNLVSE